MTDAFFSVSSSMGVNRDDKVKWKESFRIADALLVMMETWQACPPDKLRGDEFRAAQTLLSFVMASSGTHIDAVLTAQSIEELFNIHREFVQICKSRC